MPCGAFDLKGKSVLVTGGNSGLGLGTAEALALDCDLGNEQEVEQRFAETVAAPGPLHRCFANAGASGRANVRSFTER